MRKISVVQSVLKANDAVAEQNRRRFTEAAALAVNIMSAPGSGKTALLEKTLPALPRSSRAAVLLGDLQTTRDAERLSELAAYTVQINTGTGCHLTATQVAEALQTFPLSDVRYVFIENVGNMVCPAGFDLGEHLRVVLLSVAEGDDKVAKYPTLFQPADAILLTKIDLLPALDFDKNRVLQDLARINTRAPVIELSSRTGAGLDRWLAWLLAQRPAPAAASAAGSASTAVSQRGNL